LERCCAPVRAGQVLRDLGNWELSVVNADGSGQRKLARIAGDAAPAWSPDGRKVAFEGRRDGSNNGLYVMNADGSGQQRLAWRAHAPAWSPDGRRIAFIWGPKIRVMNADGTEHRTLFKGHGGGSLRWSPDGRRLAFLSVGELCNSCFTLHVVNTDGGGLKSLTWRDTAWWKASPVSDPAWSPDGQKIAFAQLERGLGIYVVKADLSGLRRLTRKSSGSHGAPAWSPDGRKIAFAVDRDDSSEVFVMNDDGSGQRRLTRGPAYDGDPSWSPDGRKLAFVSNRDGDFEVYVMNADGSGQRRLTHRGP
jgi:TolB protein